jgi:hypothetical protein
MAHGRVSLLLTATFLLPVAPLVRISVEPMGKPVPIYMIDLLLLGVAIAFFRPHRLPPRQRNLLAVGVAFVVSTIPSVLVAIAENQEALFTLYYWSRRVIALSAFATYLVIFTSRPELRRPVLAAFGAGLLVTSLWCIAQALTRSTGPVGLLDRFYYDTLARAVLQTAVSRWEASWKTVRAIGGWWNPNTAGAAIALLLACVPALPRTRWVRVTSVLAWVALLATASRQALVGSGLVLAVILGSSDRTSSRQRRVLLLAGAVGLVAAFAFAGDQLARVTGDVEGTWEEGVLSRWNNYPEAFRTLYDSSPWTLIVGRGAESWTVVGRTSGTLGPGDFVSNTFMLTLLESGALTLLALLGFFAAAFWTARAAWQRAVVVLVVWLMNADNHLYLAPGLIAVMGIVVALAATPPPGGRVVKAQSRPAVPPIEPRVVRRPAIRRASSA